MQIEFNAKSQLFMKIRNAFRSVFGMKIQENSPMEVQSGEAIEKPVEMLRSLPWLSLLDDELFQKIID